ncbi:MAG: YceI family protein [Planctomycetota bacterium]|nr:YceI family protein [Planctomycetota bacterium]
MPAFPSHLRAPIVLALIPLLAVALFVAQPASGEDAPVHYKVDKGHSALLFKIKHLGVSYTHGRFNDFTGFFTVDDANLKNAKIEIDIAASSIDSNDKERDDHLRGKDYFNCEEHPSIAFESTSIALASEGVYRVTGNFTLLGKTNEVTFRMTKIGEGSDPWGGHRLGYEGQLVIKRSDYGMTTMLKGIGDEVYITLGIEGIRVDPKADAKDADK